MGPIAVTRDLLNLAATPIRLCVNDYERQDGNTNLMMFSVPELIATISAGITLYPGDVIATGTPAGVGAGFAVAPERFRRGALGRRLTAWSPQTGHWTRSREICDCASSAEANQPSKRWSCAQRRSSTFMIFPARRGNVSRESKFCERSC